MCDRVDAYVYALTYASGIGVCCWLWQLRATCGIEHLLFGNDLLAPLDLHGLK